MKRDRRPRRAGGASGAGERAPRFQLRPRCGCRSTFRRPEPRRGGRPRGSCSEGPHRRSTASRPRRWAQGSIPGRDTVLARWDGSSSPQPKRWIALPQAAGSPVHPSGSPRGQDGLRPASRVGRRAALRRAPGPRHLGTSAADQRRRHGFGAGAPERDGWSGSTSPGSRARSRSRDAEGAQARRRAGGRLRTPAPGPQVRQWTTAGGPSRLVLTEGRKREVRRLLEAVGHPVLTLAQNAVRSVSAGRARSPGPGGPHIPESSSRFDRMFPGHRTDPWREGATGGTRMPDSTLSVEVEHPLIEHKLSLLRDVRTEGRRFRELVTEITHADDLPRRRSLWKARR